MTELKWLHPEALWALPVAVLVLIVWRFRARRTFVGFTAVRFLSSLRYRPSRVRRLPDVLGVAGLALLVAALMDPAMPYSEEEIRAQGLDIAVVLDLSSSMQEAMDSGMIGALGSSRRGGDTRLDTTKRAISDFIRRRPGDRIGLVVFSDNAYVVSPLTFDHENLLSYINIVDDQILRGEGMTAIGDGIALANYLLERQSTGETQNKVVVVFTDGEHNFGRDPLLSLQDSDRAAIRVHVIGVDLSEEVKQKPAVRGLIDTVRRYGGRYYDADTVTQLRAAYSDIDSVEKGLLASRAYIRNAPVYQWFAAPGLVVLLAAIWLRTVPYFADFT